MKISFTGTRKGMTASQKTCFESVLKSSKATLLIHGDCLGADADAHIVANKLSVEIHKRPCNLESQRAFMVGGTIIAEPENPLDRNRKIINDGDILVGCPGMLEEELRSGTWAAIRWARKINKPIILLWPDGKVEFENWEHVAHKHRNNQV